MSVIEIENTIIGLYLKEFSSIMERPINDHPISMSRSSAESPIGKDSAGSVMPGLILVFPMREKIPA